MLLIMGETLSLWQVAQARPDSAFWKFLAHHQNHSEWGGCSLHDLTPAMLLVLIGNTRHPDSALSAESPKHGMAQPRRTS